MFRQVADEESSNHRPPLNEAHCSSSVATQHASSHLSSGVFHPYKTRMFSILIRAWEVWVPLAKIVLRH